MASIARYPINMHPAFRAGFEKISAGLVPYHAPVDSAPPENVERADSTSLAPGLEDVTRKLTSKPAIMGIKRILKGIHLPPELSLGVALPTRLGKYIPETGEHSAAPVQTHDGVM